MRWDYPTAPSGVRSVPYNPKEEFNRLESFVEMALDVLVVLALTSEDAAEPVTQEVQETHPADGSSSKRPLEVEDGNRETFKSSQVNTLHTNTK